MIFLISLCILIIFFIIIYITVFLVNENNKFLLVNHIRKSIESEGLGNLKPKLYFLLHRLFNKKFYINKEYYIMNKLNKLNKLDKNNKLFINYKNEELVDILYEIFKYYKIHFYIPINKKNITEKNVFFRSLITSNKKAINNSFLTTKKIDLSHLFKKTLYINSEEINDIYKLFFMEFKNNIKLNKNNKKHLNKLLESMDVNNKNIYEIICELANIKEFQKKCIKKQEIYIHKIMSFI